MNSNVYHVFGVKLTPACALTVPTAKYTRKQNKTKKSGIYIYSSIFFISQPLQGKKNAVNEALTHKHTSRSRIAVDANTNACGGVGANAEEGDGTTSSRCSSRNAVVTPPFANARCEATRSQKSKLVGKPTT